MKIMYRHNASNRNNNNNPLPIEAVGDDGRFLLLAMPSCEIFEIFEQIFSPLHKVKDVGDTDLGPSSLSLSLSLSRSLSSSLFLNFEP